MGASRMYRGCQNQNVILFYLHGGLENDILLFLRSIFWVKHLYGGKNAYMEGVAIFAFFLYAGQILAFFGEGSNFGSILTKFV